MIDFMGEVNDLLLFITGIEQVRLFRGNQSREVLPEDNSYIIYTPILQRRIGSNISVLHAEGVEPDKDAPNTDTKLLQVDIQVDCYGDMAFDDAQRIETFAGSHRCNEWLKQAGFAVRVNYASNPADMTLVDETRQYVERWTTTLTITITADYTDNIPWVEEVEVNVITEKPEDEPAPTPTPPIKDQKGDKLISVDVVFPPNEQ